MSAVDIAFIGAVGIALLIFIVGLCMFAISAMAGLAEDE